MISRFDAVLNLVDTEITQKKDGTITYRDRQTPPSEEQIQAKIAELQATEPLRLLRIQRNQLLTQTDWRMVSDYPGTNQNEWQTYRQALRDITTQTPSLDSNGQLSGITWPTPPTD
jgi:hypothetical protein